MHLGPFMSGAVFASSAIAALFFLKFWRRTRDRFYGIFACAFLLLALERLPMVVVPAQAEARSLIFLIRLFAYVLILAAIVDKNRGGRVSDDGR